MPSQNRATLDRELKSIQDNLLRMGSLLDAAIQFSMQSLVTRNAALARQVVNDDAQINKLRFEIEEQCLDVIATQQPMATDLRVVVAAMNIVSDLERMADHAAGVAKIVVKMGDEPLLKPLIDLPRMAEACRDITRKALDAYVNHDVETASAMAKMDDVIDDFHQQIFRELLSFMIADPSTTSRALYLIFVSHNLERIGDRAVNIAERVIFMTVGEMKELSAGPDAPL
ncbi:MAG: phosphate signaling complex protein PhoU [Chloroflexi bacterium]|nr:phosphate signaling complex protein PhoU [Chloroflexota bacterium]MBI5714301.1 phosphate signaling complex protein PhoU [Chloroflexota bacterium]